MIEIWSVIFSICGFISALFSLIVVLYVTIILVNRKKVEPGMKITRWNIIMGKKGFRYTTRLGSVGIIPIFHRYEILPYTRENNSAIMDDLEVPDGENFVHVTVMLHFEWSVKDLERFQATMKERTYDDVEDLVSSKLFTSLRKVFMVTDRKDLVEKNRYALDLVADIANPELQKKGLIVESLMVTDAQWREV